MLEGLTRIVRAGLEPSAGAKIKVATVFGGQKKYVFKNTLQDSFLIGELF